MARIKNMDEMPEVLIYKQLLEKSKGPRFCIERNVHAALVTEGNEIYYGQNGCEADPCTKKGGCTRENGPAEYVTCPSFCAEGSAIFKALGLDDKSIKAINELGLSSYLADYISSLLFDEKVLEGSEIITTDLPCPRCISIASDAGIREIWFGNYKKIKPRLIDAYRAAGLTSSGIKLHRIIRCVNEQGNIEYVSKNISPGLDMESFAVGKHTRGEGYIRMMFDEGYRTAVMNGANFLKKHLEPFMNIDPDCFIFPDKWDLSEY